MKGFITSTRILSSLAFGNLLFVIPLLFFSIRTWISGKGWSAIATHSAWNGMLFAAGCTYGESHCTILIPEENAIALLAIISCSLPH
jgi:hypothetical protein